MNDARARGLARMLWLALVIWQFTWLSVLPAPYGKDNLFLGTLLTLPLLVPLAGILRRSERALIWGGYLALLAGTFGIMELWSAPEERPAAGLQLALSVAYLYFLALATRRRRD